MKSLSKPLLVLLLCLTTAVSFSQTKKPVFAVYPDNIEFNKDQLTNAFSVSEGETIIFHLDGKLTLTGKVISNIQKYDNLQSMTVILPDFADAVFHLSKQINSDRTNEFVGRILSTSASDGYQLKKDANGIYSLQKIEEGKLRQVCNN